MDLKSKRLERIAKGLCRDCSAPLVSNVYCEKCLQKKRQKANYVKSARLDSGQCVGCGKNPATNRMYCAECMIREKNRLDNLFADGLCRCKNPVRHGRKSCEKCLGTRRVAHVNLKIECLNAYGGCKCCCCGETELSFLSLDHKDNNGKQDRRKHPGNYYNHLKRLSFPKDINLQVLCMNCQFGRKHNNGICPHQKEIL